jgi:hypothetical protein
MVDGGSDLVQWVGVGVGWAREMVVDRRRRCVRWRQWLKVGGGGRGCWPCWGREKSKKKREKETILGGKINPIHF